MKTLREIEQEYNLELDKIVANIKKEKAKSVLLQFPDGMKPYADVICAELEKKMPAVNFSIWLGSCYGACDVPAVDDKVDMIVQFGHSEWTGVENA